MASGYRYVPELVEQLGWGGIVLTSGYNPNWIGTYSYFIPAIDVSFFWAEKICIRRGGIAENDPVTLF